MKVAELVFEEPTEVSDNDVIDAVEWNELERSEAWVISLLASGFTEAGILKMSPLGEEKTRELLKKQLRQ